MGSSGGCGSEDGRGPVSLPPLLVQLLHNHGVVRLVLSKAEMPAENTLEILYSSGRSRGRMLLKMLRTLRSRALLCLNNLVAPLAADDLGGPEALFSAWAGLGRLCFGEERDASKEKEEDPELMEAATSALRALTLKMAEAGGGCAERLRGSLGEEDLRRMASFGAGSGEPSVRANMVHVVGGVGGMLVLNAAKAGGGSGKAEELAANFLLEAAAKDSHLRVVAEALDKIFDLFAEDSTDALAASVSLVPRLRGLQPGLRAKMGTQRQSAGEESYAMAVMAKTNLTRFIKYKEKRPAALNGGGAKNGH